jgi:hypothetical protein
MPNGTTTYHHPNRQPRKHEAPGGPKGESDPDGHLSRVAC